MSNHNRTVDLEEVDQILEALFTRLRRELRDSIWEKVETWTSDDCHVVEESFSYPWYLVKGERCHVCGSTATLHRTHRSVPDSGIFQCDNCETSAKTSLYCQHPGGIHPEGRCDCPVDFDAGQEPPVE